jgi:hypothetical protein
MASKCNGIVAQSVEQGAFNSEVIGSIPIYPTKYKRSRGFESHLAYQIYKGGISMKGYQIACSGIMALFNNKLTHHSRKIYLNPPSQEEIDGFIKCCCTPINDHDMKYLDDSSDIEVKIVEVEIIE